MRQSASIHPIGGRPDPRDTLALLRLMVAVAGFSFLSACSNAHNHYLGNYDPSMLSYAAKEGALYTEIRGNPFNAPKRQVDQMITDTMYGSHFGPLVPFVLEEPEDYRSPYRIIIVFDPDPLIDASNYCREDVQPGPTELGKIRFVAALCANEDRETSVTLRGRGITSPDDARFRQMVRQMTALILPRKNPTLRSGRGSRLTP